MKKIFHTVLCCLVILGLNACSNGDYNADPASNANGAVNPITPLTPTQFTWTGDEPMSADINGNRWKADNATWALDTNGANIVLGTKDNSPIRLSFYLSDVWGDVNGGNTYSMEWKDYDRFGLYTDSMSIIEGGFYSYLSNSGGIKILRNDSVVFQGLFYFKGVSPTGKVVNISNGYFKIDK
ncbi:MAG: hypothetical protein K9G49_10620 [Taibaiella sp.]|nr:hypothetical protein [Taibaiella sp.]